MSITPSISTRLISLSWIALVAIALAGCQTDKGATWPAFGTYRLPYDDGTPVHVSKDFTTHDPIGRYDLNAPDETHPRVVAAADGWVRFIVDSNTGHGVAPNNYVWIEHPFPYCQANGVTWPGKPADYGDTCVPCSTNRCNEWTKYSHMSTDSTRGDAGLSEGDWVTAGQFLGFEDDIGIASGKHLHWEVAKLDPDDPIDSEGFAVDWSNGGWTASPNVLPSICEIGTLHHGDYHTAAPCPMYSKQTQRVTMTLLAQSPLTTPPTSSASALVDIVPGAGRITLSSVALQAPVILGYGGATITVQKLALVRPLTIPLSRAGTGSVAADQLIWSATMISTSPNGAQKRSRLSGPIRGRVDVQLNASTVQLSLDAASVGHVNGVGDLVRWLGRPSP